MRNNNFHIVMRTRVKVYQNLILIALCADLHQIFMFMIVILTFKFTVLA